MTGRAAQTPGLRQVFSLFERLDRPSCTSTSTAPRRRCWASTWPTCSARCRPISAPTMSTTSICSGRTFRVTAQAEEHLPARPQGCSPDQGSQFEPLGNGAARSFTPDRAGLNRALPRAPLQPLSGRRPTAPPAPGYSQGQAIQTMQQLAAEALPDGFTYEWTTLAFQQVVRAIRRFLPSCWQWYSYFWFWPPNMRA